jgi:hypothetical protein
MRESVLQEPHCQNEIAEVLVWGKPSHIKYVRSGNILRELLIAEGRAGPRMDGRYLVGRKLKVFDEVISR